MASTSIAVSGKGGTGKSTLAGLIVRHLLEAGETPILAVDADPNSNLGDTIGVPVDRTVGSTLAEFFNEKMKLPAGMAKETYLETRLNQILAEGKGVDLLAMGRGEGPGCYCFPNLMVRKFMDELSGNYRFMVMDNQAGMEHLSRHTTDRLDVLLIVASPTVKGVRTAGTIVRMVKELELSIGKMELVMSRASGPLDDAVAAELEREELTPSALIPDDPLILQYDLDRKPLTGLPDDSPAVQAAGKLISNIL